MGQKGHEMFNNILNKVANMAKSEADRKVEILATVPEKILRKIEKQIENILEEEGTKSVSDLAGIEGEVGVYADRRYFDDIDNAVRDSLPEWIGVARKRDFADPDVIGYTWWVYPTVMKNAAIDRQKGGIK